MAGFVGIDKVVHNLAKAIDKIEGRTQAGILKAALHVRGEAQKLCPVDEGNLKNSAYTVSKDTIQDAEKSFKGKDAYKHSIDHNMSVIKSKSETTKTKIPMAIIGFTAYYAVYVHEINKKYTVGQWQFLKTALEVNRKKTLNTIAREASV